MYVCASRRTSSTFSTHEGAAQSHICFFYNRSPEVSFPPLHPSYPAPPPDHPRPLLPTKVINSSCNLRFYSQEHTVPHPWDVDFAIYANSLSIRDHVELSYSQSMLIDSSYSAIELDFFGGAEGPRPCSMQKNGCRNEQRYVLAGRQMGAGFRRFRYEEHISTSCDVLLKQTRNLI